MLKKTGFTITRMFYINTLSFAQNDFESELDSIQTLDEAKILRSRKINHVKGKVITFNKEKHHTRIADELFRSRKRLKKSLSKLICR